MTTRSPGSRTVLMCGGPAHGTWRALESWERQVIVAKPVKIDVHDTKEQYPAPERITYDVRPLVVLGHELWVAVAIGEAYDDRAVMKAVLQRDVAQHLGAYR